MRKNNFSSAILALTIFSLPLYSSSSASYNGNSGILETPNARIMPDWSMRMFVNKDKPYTYYGVTGTPLPFLEGNFHMTQVDGIAGFSDSAGYGDYKDKSINLKILLQEEKTFLPSVVFGADDIDGTSLYSSKYIAFGKQIDYFDLTLGYAKGRLGGEDLRKYQVDTTNSGSSDNNAFNFMKDMNWGGGKPFGSVVFNATPKISLMAEYSPINYEYDKINPFLNGNKHDLPDSKINVGTKYKLGDNSTLSLSFQRGNQIAFGYVYQFGFSRDGLYPHEPDIKWKADEKKKKEYENLDEKQLSDKLSKEVSIEKFTKVQTSVNENKIWTEIENTRYNNDLKAVGRTISTIDEVAPEKYDTIYTTIKRKDVPIKTIKVNRQEYDAYENGKLSGDYFKNAVIITNSVEQMEKEFKEEKKDIYKTDNYAANDLNYNIAPVLKTYLNAKDKPFSLKASIGANLSYDISKGLFFRTSFSHPLYNSIKDIDSSYLESNELSIRSNMLDYYKYNSTQMQNFSLDYVFRLPYSSLGKVELGYFDLAFAGADFEWYKSYFDDSFGLGLEYQYVYKRAVDDMIQIYDDLSYDAKFLNIYYLLSPVYDTHLGLKVGEFLGNDRGVKIDIMRHYKDFTVGAFATFTNSDEVFSSEQNRGYIDKGIFISVPLEVFTKDNVKGRVAYGISPWTRDVGQYSSTSYSLYPMNNSENNINVMKRSVQKIIE